MNLYNACIKDAAVHVSSFFSILSLFLYIYMFWFLPFILIVFFHFRFHYSSTHFLKSRLLIYRETVNPDNTQHCHSPQMKSFPFRISLCKRSLFFINWGYDPDSIFTHPWDKRKYVALFWFFCCLFFLRVCAIFIINRNFSL